MEGLNDTEANLLAAIERNEAEVSPSTLYAVACIQEGVPFINGSPQNTFVPGCIDMAVSHNVLIGGDDFKSGQTKMKSVLVDFLVGAGLKPTSIVSYNHLGNNDGMNLSAPQTFRCVRQGLALRCCRCCWGSHTVGRLPRCIMDSQEAPMHSSMQGMARCSMLAAGAGIAGHD